MTAFSPGNLILIILVSAVSGLSSRRGCFVNSSSSNSRPRGTVVACFLGRPPPPGFSVGPAAETADMAPKNVLKKTPKAKASAATITKKSGDITKQSHKTPLAAEYPGQIDRWEAKRQAKCDSCKQFTSTIDRHSPPSKPKFLHWVQWRLATGPNATVTAAAAKACAKTLARLARQKDFKYPSGTECYPCYNVRHKFHKGQSQEQLDTARGKDSELDDLCNSQRHDAVGEVGELAGVVKAKVAVESTKPDFDKRLVTGTFTPLWEFAEKRILKVQPEGDTDTMVDLVEAKYPDYKVVVDKEGVVGVEIPDQTGGEYRYERGANNYTAYTKSEKLDSEPEARKLYMMLNASAQCAADDRVLVDAAHRAAGPSASSASASSMQSQELLPPTITPKEVVEIDDTQTQLQSTQQDDTAASVVNHRGLLPARRRTSAASSKSAALSDGQQSEAGTLLEDGHGNGFDSRSDGGRSNVSAGTTSTKRTAIEREVEEGRKALDKVLQDFGADQHLDRSRQSKSCEQAVSRLRKWARKIGKSKSKDDQHFSQTLHDAADEI